MRRDGRPVTVAAGLPVLAKCSRSSMRKLHVTKMTGSLPPGAPLLLNDASRQGDAAVNKKAWRGLIHLNPARSRTVNNTARTRPE